MSSTGTGKGILEIAKFAVYVSIPVGLMYAFASNTTNLEKVMGKRKYVVYPPEALRPLSPEERQELGLDIAHKKDGQ
ncbi:Protein Pet100 [Dillenia turbinata]|uniref:Protein Pet100 n=1 Tax=Dillenia turbinata TaxID=194707 RepID=A0AAN8ZCG9_9MAGN